METTNCYNFVLVLLTRLLLASTVVISGTSWSSCSHSCNSGIMSRDCLSENCSKTALEYSSCNNQECSTLMADVRDQQCIKLIEEYMPQYSHLPWKAVKNGRVGELCELFCSCETIEIAPPIDNGTPCVNEDGTEGRCLGKLCAPVGCDGILGSDKHYDSCHRCLRDGKNNQDCKNFENTLTIKNSTLEQTMTSFIPINSMSVTIKYNQQIELLSLSNSQNFPTNITECSLDGNTFEVHKDGTITATGPLTQALTIILKPSDSTVKPTVTFEYHLLVQSGTADNIQHDGNGTYQWRQGEFGACSVTCGGGVEIAHNYCQDSAFPDKVMPDKFCQTTNKPFPIVRKCSKSDCPPRWVTGNWGVCSTICGNGTQYRSIKCWKKRKDGSDFYVSISECNGLSKPDATRECNARPCGTHWKAFDWLTCSRRCGLGIQNRTVVCVDDSSQTVEELYCLEDGNKPVSIRPCDEGPCSYSWYTSDWSKCSQSCGEGIKTRTVYCSDQNAIPVDDINCVNLSKPSLQQSCHEITGCFAAWIKSSWGPCHEPCGSALQTRTVECYVFVGNKPEAIPDMCNNSTRPNASRNCPKDQCPQWTTGEWGKCSAECGQGTMHRTVLCIKGSVTSNECDINIKPPDSKDCQIKPCTECSDNPKMNCFQMKSTYGCDNSFIQQVCCQTCST